MQKGVPKAIRCTEESLPNGLPEMIFERYLGRVAGFWTPGLDLRWPPEENFFSTSLGGVHKSPSVPEVSFLIISLKSPVPVPFDVFRDIVPMCYCSGVLRVVLCRFEALRRDSNLSLYAAGDLPKGHVVQLSSTSESLSTSCADASMAAIWSPL